jgi:hypothetical protein
MVSPHNPYSPPGSAVADVTESAGSTGFSAPGRKVEAGGGASWIGGGWKLYKAAPMLWIVALLILACIDMVLGAIPILGQIANALLYPVFMVGVLAFARGIADGEEAQLGNLFAGFREKLGPLVLLGVVYILMGLMLLAVLGGLLAAMVGLPASLDAEGLRAYSEGLVAADALLPAALAFLVVMALGIPVAAAFWLAPGLVYYTELGVGAAIKESLRCCLRNWLPFLIYGILGILVMVGGMFLLIIGMFLVSLPVLMASYYSSFSDLYGQKA